MNNKTVNILVIDDSLVFRHAVEDSLRGEDGVEIIGSVRNGVRAMEFIALTPPDLVTLDVEMPDMDGLETLKQIQAFNTQHNLKPGIGVIMLSSHTKKGAESTISALESGAFDFITKPVEKSELESIASLKRLLLPRIHHFASMRSLGKPINRPTTQPVAPTMLAPLSTESSSGAIKAVVIGLSTGGPKALSEMLPLLSQKVKLPIFIVQHMPEKFTLSLAESLARKCTHKVKEGEDCELVDANTIYIAPGGRHMLLRLSGSGAIISVTDHPPENGCRPSVDVLFRSVPAVYGSGVVAIILTGMGSDGSKSLRTLKRSGCAILAQDEATSVVWGMPGCAVATGFTDEIVPLMEIPEMVVSVISQRAAIGVK